MIAMKNTVMGQQKIKELFKRALSQNKLGHCYALIGEEGMGKSVLAEHIARMIVCENHTACDSCKACVMARAGSHPDIVYLTPEEGKSYIGVDRVRELVSEEIYVKPYSSEKKVVIVRNFDTANPQAQNAMLKVLEEPPEYVVFLLTLSAEESILDTVKSRAIMLKLQPYSESEIKTFLSDSVGVSGQTADFLFAYASGNPGRAEKLATDENFAVLRKSVAEAIEALTEYKNILPFSGFAVKEKTAGREEFLGVTLSFYRDMLMIKTGRQKDIINRDFEALLLRSAEKIKTENLLEVMERILSVQWDIRHNVSFNITVPELILGHIQYI